MLKAIINGNKEIELSFDRQNSKKGLAGGTPFQLDIVKNGDNTFHVLKNNRSYNVEILEADAAAKKYVVLVNGRKYEAELKSDFDQLLESMGLGGGAGKQTREVKAPMPGLVLDILVGEGSEVVKGDPLLILEAMKMENVLKSPTDGVVKKVNVNKGTAVEKNQVLVSFS